MQTLIKGLIMNRYNRYVLNQKKSGKKRVSFFCDIKLWNYISKRAKKQNITIEQYLKQALNFK